MNSYASPTPAIADGRVVCHFGNYGTWCLDSQTGEKKWHREFIVEHSVGPGSSPVIVDGLAVLVCDGTDLQYMRTGENIWKTDRPPIRAQNGEFRKAYSTPLLTELHGKRQLVVPGAQWIAGYAPANGTELWRADFGDGYSVTPMASKFKDDLIFCSGYNDNEFVAVRPSGEGQQPESTMLWRTKSASPMSTPILAGDCLYSLNDQGVLVCLDAATGKVRHRTRALTNVSASPLLAAGHLYFFNRSGNAIVVKCDEELKTVFEFDMGAPVLASPVPVGNDLLVRTEKELIRITKSK
jgi:hypothetical protein